MPDILSDRSERTRGLLVGLACGDLLGLPWETVWPRKEIRRRSGGNVRDLDPAERDRPWDDEPAEALEVVAALAETGRIDPDDLGRRLLAWRERSGRGIDNVTNRVLDDIEGEMPALEAAREASERLGRNWSAGNGGLARTLPLVAAFGSDRERLADEVRSACGTTHANPLCLWSAIALELGLADLLASTPRSLLDLAEELNHLGAPGPVVEATRGARAPLGAFQLDGKQKSFVLKTLQVGLWASRAEGETLDLLESVVLEGGATGTNAAVAGAVLGWRRGPETFPEAWRAVLFAPEALEQAARALLAFPG